MEWKVNCGVSAVDVGGTAVARIHAVVNVPPIDGVMMLFYWRVLVLLEVIPILTSCSCSLRCVSGFCCRS
jgi:hypothetical protein